MAPPVRERTKPKGGGSVEPPKPRQRAMQLEVPEAKMRVRRTVYGQETEKEVLIETPVFQGPVAYLRVGGAVTKNLGDYNSAKVDVSLSLPCYPTDDEIKRAYRHASTLVDEMVSRELDIATGKKNPEDD